MMNGLTMMLNGVDHAHHASGANAPSCKVAWSAGHFQEAHPTWRIM